MGYLNGHSSNHSVPSLKDKDFVIYHQNLRGLNTCKLDELSISPVFESSHIVCLTKHHLWDTAMDAILMTGFRLGASFCRNTFKNGGVCIFVRETIYFTSMSVEKYCIEKDIEACAVMLRLPAHEIRVIAIYRAPSGNFQYFFQNLDKLLNKILLTLVI
jgi:hypothetical protein